MHPESNAVYAKVRTSENNRPLCAVCSMDSDPAIAASIYKGKSYYFCSQDHKAQFDSAPERFVAVIERQ
jgi:YHS domain-containing protein